MTDFFSLPIRQALAFDTLESKHRPFPIGKPEARAVRVSERKFVQITLQVFLAAKHIRSAHTALEHAEKVLDVIGGIAALVHPTRAIAPALVPNALMAAELFSDLLV